MLSDSARYQETVSTAIIAILKVNMYDGDSKPRRCRRLGWSLWHLNELNVGSAGVKNDTATLSH